jgi:hypothetical protein
VFFNQILHFAPAPNGVAFFPKSSLNSAMIGILAERKLLANVAPTSLDEEINPGWVLADGTQFSEIILGWTTGAN